MTDFLMYWRASSVENSLGEVLTHAASNQLGRVDEGDTLWITALLEGVFTLVGKIEVGQVVDRREAERILSTSHFWEAAYYVIAKRGTVMPVVRIPIDSLARKLRFLGGVDRLTMSNGWVRGQELQSMRRLTPESAAVLRATLERELLRGGTGAGRQIADADAADEITDVVDRLTGRRNSQGILVSPKVRRAIEDYAMSRARIHFEAEGYSVEDVHASEPVDLIARRGRQIRRVEVKGTQTDGDEILLTPGEVRYAREHKGEMVLFIVAAVEVTEEADRDVVVAGGVERVIRWDVDEGELEPVGYRYRPKSLSFHFREVNEMMVDL